MLQSGQFIENRVVRDQIAVKKIEEEKKRKQQEEEQKANAQNEQQQNPQNAATAIIETYKKALNLGMAAMQHTIPQSHLASSLKSQQDAIEAGIAPNLPKCKKVYFRNDSHKHKHMYTHAHN